MRKRTLGIVLLTGLAVSAAGASTASNTVDASVAGYGEATVSGVVVSDFDYVLDSTASAVSSLKMTTATSIAGKSLVVKLQNGADDAATASNAVGSTNLCTITLVTGLGATCSFATPVPLESFDGLAVSVVDND